MTTQTDLLERLINSTRRRFSAEHAKYVLSLDFPKSDHLRYQKLSAKAQAGTMTPKEGVELDEYLAANALLTVLQSKARLALRKHTSAA